VIAAQRFSPPVPGGRTGLTSQEAAARLGEYGPNRVLGRRRVHPVRRVAGQLSDPLSLVLLVAAALTVITGDHADAVIISVVVVANTTVGVVQEIRADGAIRALSALAAPTARVVRDGRAVPVPATDLVPGDLLELGEGDVVPADADLLEGAALLIDEAALTGESVPVGKQIGGASGRLQAGTVVVRGRAVAQVTATGADSATGRIAALMDTRPTQTPLQRKLAGLGRRLALLTSALCLVVMAQGLISGQPLELMVITAISLAVAAVPESLPAVVTLALALGARRMAARRAIVRRLPAVETLGAITVIATDKTGTLTSGTMVAEALWTSEGEASVTGSGYSPAGDVVTDAGRVTVESGPRAMLDLITSAALCCDARLMRPTTTGGEDGPADGEDDSADGWTALGDPTEAALLALAAKVGVNVDRLVTELPRVAELPFDSERGRMTTVHREPCGGLFVACKGAPEVLLQPEVVDADPILLAAAQQRTAGYAADGYRVLAVASRHRRDPAGADGWESGLHLLGLIAIADPPRRAAAGTVAACRAAGITPVLITGDHVATARAIAVRVGLAGPTDQIVSGAELGDGQVPDPTVARVFARTTPEQKLAVVQAWRDAGHVVAMTGDGVNDGPALHRADIGVAMGRRGTEVARQAADLVLADDDLATVVSAVEEGRRVYANVRRFLLYGLSGGVAEIVVMLLGPFLGLSLPLLPAQILWINLLTHGVPGVAFGAEPAAPDVMRRPPRRPEQSVLGDGLWQRIGRSGGTVAASTLAVACWGLATDRPWQSMAFFTLAAAQLAVGLGVRARPGTWSNPALLIAVVVAFSAQVAALYLPALNNLLGTRALTGTEVGLACLAAIPGYLVARFDRRRTERRHARDGERLRAEAGTGTGTGQDGERR
jgi:Ca2+-transporting ATPase